MVEVQIIGDLGAELSNLGIVLDASANTIRRVLLWSQGRRKSVATRAFQRLGLEMLTVARRDRGSLEQRVENFTLKPSSPERFVDFKFSRGHFHSDKGFNEYRVAFSYNGEKHNLVLRNSRRHIDGITRVHTAFVMDEEIISHYNTALGQSIPGVLQVLHSHFFQHLAEDFLQTNQERIGEVLKEVFMDPIIEATGADVNIVVESNQEATQLQTRLLSYVSPRIKTLAEINLNSKALLKIGYAADLVYIPTGRYGLFAYKPDKNRFSNSPTMPFGTSLVGYYDRGGEFIRNMGYEPEHVGITITKQLPTGYSALRAQGLQTRIDSLDLFGIQFTCHMRGDHVKILVCPDRDYYLKARYDQHKREAIITGIRKANEILHEV